MISEPLSELILMPFDSSMANAALAAAFLGAGDGVGTLGLREVFMSASTNDVEATIAKEIFGYKSFYGVSDILWPDCTGPINALAKHLKPVEQVS